MGRMSSLLQLGASAAGEDELRSQLARADAAADEMRRVREREERGMNEGIDSRSWNRFDCWLQREQKRGERRRMQLSL